MKLLIVLLFLVVATIILGRKSLKLKQTWSNRLGVTLTPIATDLWAAERPFIWNNIDVGGRSVIARINDEEKSLLVHSPVEWHEDLGSAILSLGGEIKYIISPNFEHIKYTKQWSEKYPRAIMIGCPGISEKIPEIDWYETNFLDSCEVDLCSVRHIRPPHCHVICT